MGAIPGKDFGLGGAVTFAPTPSDPPNSKGEFQWGGLAGTHWWICPEASTAGVLMAQREMAFWNPFMGEFKRVAFDAEVAAHNSIREISDQTGSSGPVLVNGKRGRIRGVGSYLDVSKNPSFVVNLQTCQHF
jgi:CubicO group peptidase (beta-lactamase class C family)